MMPLGNFDPISFCVGAAAGLVLAGLMPMSALVVILSIKYFFIEMFKGFFGKKN